MNILTNILNRVVIVMLQLRRGEGPGLHLLCVRYRKGKLWLEQWLTDVPYGQAETYMQRYPVILLVTGYGVIVRNCGEDLSFEHRIRSDREFLWNILMPAGEAKQFVFVRNGQVSPLLKQLEKGGIIPLRLDILPGEGDRKLAFLRAKQFYDENLKMKKLFVPGTESDRLAGLLAGKLKLPALLLLLCVLGINYPLRSLLQRRYSLQQAEYARVRQKVSEQHLHSEKTRLIFREFGEDPAERLSVLADRIASLLPETVVLESLVLNPLKKRVEELKPLPLQRHYIRLEGYTSVPGEITVLTARLSERNPDWQIKLITLTTRKDSEDFHFEIGIRL